MPTRRGNLQPLNPDLETPQILGREVALDQHTPTTHFVHPVARYKYQARYTWMDDSGDTGETWSKPIYYFERPIRRSIRDVAVRQFENRLGEGGTIPTAIISMDVELAHAYRRIG